MDFLFSGKLSDKQHLFQKKNVLESINNQPNKAIKDSAGNILVRNRISLNNNIENSGNYVKIPFYKEMSSISQANSNSNNYLNPLGVIDKKERCNLSPNLSHNADFILQRRKLHNRVKSENFNLVRGDSVNIENYFTLKKNSSERCPNKNNDRNLYFEVTETPKLNKVTNNIRSSYLKNRNSNRVIENSNNSILSEFISKNNLSLMNNNINNDKFLNSNKNYEIFDEKNNLFNNKNRRLVKQNLYNPNYNEKEFQTSLVSSDSPNWFKNPTNERINSPDSEPLFVFSKHNSWITVTPKKKNRNDALEKRKIVPHETCIIAPTFMQINYEKKPRTNIFKSVLNESLRTNVKGGVLIEKHIEKPSLFNFGTYNHNVISKEEAIKLNENLPHNYRRLYPNTQVV